MKITKLLLFKIAMGLTLLSCHDSMDLPPEENGPPGEDIYFSIPAAKTYFENNAQDLAFLRFSDSIPFMQTRSSSSSDLIPEWDKAIMSTNNQVNLIELPIRSNTLLVSTRNKIKDGQIMISRTNASTARLIVARRKNGLTDMFIATLVPSLKNNPKSIESMKNFRYLGGSDFTGIVFCSTLEGRFVEACQYTNGKRSGRVEISIKKQLEAKGIDFKNESYESVVLHQNIKTRSGTYQFDEKCEFHPEQNSSDCPFCLDEVVVKVCAKCGAKLEEGQFCFCQICDGCHNIKTSCTCGDEKPAPQRCPVCHIIPCIACSLCGNHYCYGSCSDRPPSGSGSNPDPNPEPNPEPDPILCTCSKCPRCHRCINPQTPNCTRCICPSLEIGISLNSTTIELGEKLQIRVTCNDFNAKCNYIAYYISKNGDERSVRSFNSSPQLAIEEMIRQPGTYKVHAEAQFDHYNSFFSSNELSFTCVYPSIHKIKGLAVVQNGMNTAWANTLSSADKHGSQEYGGVVMIHTQPGKDGQYTFVPKAGNKTSYDKNIVDIELDWTDNSINDFRNGGDYCIMIFHTHPPLWHCTDKKKERPLGPSELDILNHTRIPAIVYDFDKEIISSYTPETPRDSCIRKEYIYGPERRIN